MPETYEPIAKFDLTGGYATVDFNSIPSTYTDLKVIFTTIGNVNFYPNIYMRFNGDTGNNYSFMILQGSGSGTPGTNRSNNTDRITLSPPQIQTEQPTLLELDIFSYTSSRFKSCLAKNSNEWNSSGYVSHIAGAWRGTAAITSISFFTTSWFYNNGQVSLYGIKGA